MWVSEADDGSVSVWPCTSEEAEAGFPPMRRSPEGEWYEGIPSPDEMMEEFAPVTDQNRREAFVNEAAAAWRSLQSNSDQDPTPTAPIIASWMSPEEAKEIERSVEKGLEAQMLDDLENVESRKGEQGKLISSNDEFESLARQAGQFYRARRRYLAEQSENEERDSLIVEGQNQQMLDDLENDETRKVEQRILFSSSDESIKARYERCNRMNISSTSKKAEKVNLTLLEAKQMAVNVLKDLHRLEREARKTHEADLGYFRHAKFSAIKVTKAIDEAIKEISIGVIDNLDSVDRKV